MSVDRPVTDVPMPKVPAQSAANAVADEPAPNPDPAEAVEANAQRYDVIVVGLGAMGSAALYHSAERGLRVLGLDAHRPPHPHGSSHGGSRVIRQAYAEDPRYVPLVQRAQVLWAELAELAERPLLTPTGGLVMGPEADDSFVARTRRSAELHDVAHEPLDAAAVRQRFPGLDPADEWQGVYEPSAGALDPEACVSAHLDAATALGAVVRYDQPVLAWSADGSGVQVTTSAGTVAADQLILAAGPWMPKLVPLLAPLLTIERQIQVWFTPVRPADAALGRLPIYILEVEPGRYVYGFPDLGRGAKAAYGHSGQATTVDTVDRTVAEDEVAALRSVLARHVPAVAGPGIDATVCLYTTTPDGHFILDRHPEHGNVLLASPCSGHGFKFAAAIGEALAERVVGVADRLDWELFRLGRFGG